MKVHLTLAIGVVSVAGVLAAQTPRNPAFDVASVKPNTSGAAQQGVRSQGDQFTATNVPLRLLIQMAYNIGTDRLIGGPSWMNNDRFDIVAKAAAPFSPPNEWQLMLRTLLTDRFKLMIHTETRDTPTYALVMARSDGKLGPKLHPATADCATLRAAAPPGEKDPCGLLTVATALVTGRMSVRGLDFSSLAVLARDAGRRVVNKTGLTGAFDWDLTWTPQSFLQGPFNRERFPSIDSDGPSIFTAVQEQLGLKLESQKGEGEVLVIDRVEHPTED